MNSFDQILRYNSLIIILSALDIDTTVCIKRLNQNTIRYTDRRSKPKLKLTTVSELDPYG